MPETLSNLEQLDVRMRPAVSEYGRLLQDLFDTQLESLTVFGRVLTSQFNPEVHTVSSVLVLKDIDLDRLKKLSEHGLRLGKLRLAAPMIMTPKYIEASCDVFPLELLEIQQMHVAVLGEDAFNNLTFQVDHVRLQCEREIKSIMIGLRQGLLAAAGKERLIGALESHISDNLIRILRGWLWLKDFREPKPVLEVLREIETLSDRKFTGIRHGLDSTAKHGWEQFKALYADVSALEGMINAG